VTPEQFRAADLKGGRRPLRVPLAGAKVEETREGLWIEFRLPAGCYATTVLDEIMKTDEAADNEGAETSLDE
jgi:tRNA pseudouridine13 synthase